MERRLRRYTVCIICILVIQITFGAIVSSASLRKQNKSNDVIIVDQTGNGDYTSIQEAIKKSDAGSTILVKKGEYKEILEINKKISLVGEGKDATLINPISEKNKYALRLGAAGIIIKDMSISNKAPGIYSSCIRISASNTKISNCKFFDTPIGIAIWSSENIVENCEFTGCSDEGIALLGSEHHNCEKNKISNCVFYKNCDAIELQYSSKNTIQNCKIYENTHSGIDAILSSNDDNVISDCEIYNNKVHGVFLVSSSYNKITNCKIYDNKNGDIVEYKESKDNEFKNIQYQNQEKIKFSESTLNFDGYNSELLNRFVERISNNINFNF